MPSLRSRISAAAQELYLSEGVEGVSMRKVADRVGVSAPAIYKHFKNKEELLDEIVIHGLKILADYLRPALDAPTPYERLVRMTEHYLDFALEQPKYFDFAFLTPSPRKGEVADEIAHPEWDTFRLAVGQIAACAEDGMFHGGDPLETAIIVWAEVHGLVTLYRTGRFGSDPDAFRTVYRRCVDRLLRGLSRGRV
jgi:AcrR family transcriptional regulator